MKPEKHLNTDAVADISARLEQFLVEIAIFAAKCRQISDSDEKYYKDDVMGQIETYLTNGINILKEETQKEEIPQEKLNDLLKYCKYLKFQYQLFQIRKKLIDNDLEQPSPISNIDDLESLQKVFSGFGQNMRIGVGLSPKKILLPPKAEPLEWENAAGFTMTLIQGMPGRTIVESSRLLSNPKRHSVILYKENDLDAFFASLLVKGLVPADERVKNLLIQTVKFARGEPGDFSDAVKDLKIAGEKSDISSILRILGSKKKTGEILEELESLDTDVKGKLFYSKKIMEAGLAAITAEDFQYMAYSKKAVLERIAISLILENNAGSEYEDMVVHLLVSGSGDQNVIWKAGMVLAGSAPKNEGNYGKVINFARKAFRGRQRNAWYFALNIAMKGRYPELNEMLGDMFGKHKIDPEFEVVVINNAENILGPDWKTILSSSQSKNADVQSMIKDKLAGGKEKPKKLEIDLNAHKDRFMGALFGHALGDAMGAPIEMLKLAQIKALYGVVDNFVKYDYQTLPMGDYTDDTALTLVGMDSVAENRNFHPADYIKRLADLSLAMDYGKEPDRHFGGGSIMALRRLAIGQNWIFSGNKTGKNGSAIRVTPFSILDFFDPEKQLRKNVETASMPTHKDELSMEGAYMTALAVRNCLELKDIDPDAFIGKLTEECRNEALKEKLSLVQKLLKQNKPIEEVQKLLGTTSRVTDTIPYALYCFLKNPHNFKDVMVAALNIDGDSDSIAAIAGSLCGAFIGYKKIPSELVDKLLCKSKLMQYFPDKL